MLNTIILLLVTILLGGCSARIHDDVIEATSTCTGGPHSITFSQLTDGDTTEVICK